MALFAGSNDLSKQDLVLLCKSFHCDMSCNDLYGYMNHAEGKNEDEFGDVSMTILDPEF